MQLEVEVELLILIHLLRQSKAAAAFHEKTACVDITTLMDTSAGLCYKDNLLLSIVLRVTIVLHDSHATTVMEAIAQCAPLHQLLPYARSAL